MEVMLAPSRTREYLEEVKRMLDLVHDQVGPFIEVLYRAYMEDRTIFLIGNGGSAANASHFGQDLSKGTLPSLTVSKRFRALPLTDNVSFITALANDTGYENVFAQQLMTLARPGDFLVAISGSGNSPNILRAVEYANEHDMATIGVTGFAGGRLGQMVKTHLNVHSQDIGLVEAVHAVVFHLAVSELGRRVGYGAGGQVQ